MFYIFGMMYMSSMYIKGGMGMKRFITRARGNTVSKKFSFNSVVDGFNDIYDYTI